MANSTLFGALGLPETDASLINTLGQQVIYDAVSMTLAEHNTMIDASLGLWVERNTPDWKFQYKLADNGGLLQETGNRSKAAEVKPALGWDVSLPLSNYGAGFAADRITFAYMTTQELDRVVSTVMAQDRNRVRFEALKSLFNNTSRTFTDQIRGDLTIRPLANGDSVVYPPLLGSNTPATSQHYIGVASDATAFTDANNPIPTIVDKLEGHFGAPSGGSAIVIMFNNAQTAKFQALAGFEPVTNRYVTPGIANARVELEALPPLPGRVIGVSDGAILVEWRYIPAGYLVGIHLEAPKPLLRRVDTAASGLTPGLQLVCADYDHPFTEYEWQDRFGLGVGNRLNGVVMDLATGSSTYTIPTVFS